MADPTNGALTEARLAFIGTGVMAESMIAGLLARGLISPDRIIASHPREDRRKRLHERFGIETFEDNRTAAERADLKCLRPCCASFTGV